MSLLLLAFMALGSYRAWRFIGRDSWPPSEWLRSQLEAEERLAFESLQMRRADRLHTLLELIECPYCLGSWIAAAVVAWVDLLQGLELPFLQWLAVAALCGLIGRADA